MTIINIILFIIFFGIQLIKLQLSNLILTSYQTSLKMCDGGLLCTKLPEDTIFLSSIFIIPGSFFGLILRMYFWTTVISMILGTSLSIVLLLLNTQRKAKFLYGAYVFLGLFVINWNFAMTIMLCVVEHEYLFCKNWQWEFITEICVVVFSRIADLLLANTLFISIRIINSGKVINLSEIIV